MSCVSWFHRFPFTFLSTWRVLRYLQKISMLWCFLFSDRTPQNRIFPKLSASLVLLSGSRILPPKVFWTWCDSSVYLNHLYYARISPFLNARTHRYWITPMNAYKLMYNYMYLQTYIWTSIHVLPFYCTLSPSIKENDEFLAARLRTYDCLVRTVSLRRL